MKKATCIVLFQLLLFFVSCTKTTNYKELLSNNSYEILYDTCTVVLNKTIDEDALYYKAVACYYLGLNEECSDLSKLCLTMGTSNRTNLLQMILYKGNIEDAYEAGSELMAQNLMSNADRIQYYQIVLNSSHKEEARGLISEMEGILPAYDFAFAVVQSKYTSQVILDAIQDVFREEGLSTRFLGLAKEAFSLFGERCHQELVRSFVEESFDGSAQYGLILGDFYFSVNNKENAKYYWEFSKELFPNAYAARMNSVN